MWILCLNARDKFARYRQWIATVVQLENQIAFRLCVSVPAIALGSKAIKNIRETAATIMRPGIVRFILDSVGVLGGPVNCKSCAATYTQTQ